MARRYRPSYQKYRGRRSGGSAVLKVIIALLALVLAAGVLFVLFMGEYVEYTDSGVRLNLPWRKEEPEPPQESAPVVIVTEEPAASPEPSPSADLTEIRAVEVTAAQLLDGSAAQAAVDAGGNALVVEMKNADGALAWQSETELAAALAVNADDGGVAQAVRALAGDGKLYLVARVQCFLDLAMVKTRTQGTILLTKGGNVWYDSNGYCWSSPASETVTDYLTALCAELADMGFDEILLDSAGYPDFGEVDVLATDERRPEDLSAPVAAFYEKVSAALAGADTRLSVQADRRMTQLPGEKMYSGITAPVLARYADRVWLPEELSAEQYADVLRAAGLEEPEKHLVTEGGGGENGSWYVTG